jgi:cobalamin synthase
VKGARIGLGSKGAYTSLGIPGTGISSVNYVGKGKKQTAPVTQKPNGSALLGLLFVVSLVVVFIQPAIGMLFILALLIFAYMQNRKAKKTEQKASE